MQDPATWHGMRCHGVCALGALPVHMCIVKRTSPSPVSHPACRVSVSGGGVAITAGGAAVLFSATGCTILHVRGRGALEKHRSVRAR